MLKMLNLVEYETQSFDSAAFIRNGQIQLDTEAQEKAGIALRWEKGTLRLQAGGRLGAIPLNDQLVVEVRSRVPILRLEEIVHRSRHSSFVALNFERTFAAEGANFLSIDDLITVRFLALLSDLVFEGVYKSYARVHERGASPRGSLRPLETMLSLRTSFRPEAQFDAFDRTIDNQINQLILAAGNLLIDRYLGQRNTVRMLKTALTIFDGVRASLPNKLRHVEKLPSNRPVLAQLAELSRMILFQQGVRFFGQGAITLPSFLINMEDIFEAYVRNILSDHLRRNDMHILDGNKNPPLGAKSTVFDQVGPLGNHDTKPDIVIKSGNAFVCVADVKYKPCKGQPDRSNLEQVIVYALAYGAEIAVLIFPCAEGQATSIEFLGRVSDIACYKATLGLMSIDLDAEEKQFADKFLTLISPVLTPPPS